MPAFYYVTIRKARFTLDIILYLNQCRWTPAIDHGKPVRASVNVFFSFEDGQLTGSVHRVDPVNLIANMRNADPPVVYNKSTPSLTRTGYSGAQPSMASPHSTGTNSPGCRKATLL
jgi:hypothetical protein